MIIRVAEIPEDGLQIEGPGAFPRPFQDPSWALDDLSLTVEKDGETVFVKGAVVASVPQRCGRCLEPFLVTVRSDVDAQFVANSCRRGGEFVVASCDLVTA